MWFANTTGILVDVVRVFKIYIYTHTSGRWPDFVVFFTHWKNCTAVFMCSESLHILKIWFIAIAYNAYHTSLHENNQELS